MTKSNYLSTFHIDIINYITYYNYVASKNIFLRIFYIPVLLYKNLSLSKRVASYVKGISDIRDLIVEFTIFSSFLIDNFGEDTYNEITRNINYLKSIKIIFDTIYDEKRLGSIFFRCISKTSKMDILFDFDYENKIKFNVSSMNIKAVSLETGAGLDFTNVFDGKCTESDIELLDSINNMLKGFISAFAIQALNSINKDMI